MFSQGADDEAQKALLQKFKDTQHFLNYKDPKLPPEKMLDVDEKQLIAAKEAELMKPIRVRFLQDGPDRTIDNKAKFPKVIEVAGVSAQESILQLRQKIARTESMPIEDINIFAAETVLDDRVQLSECYADWMGFGLEDWPPKLIVKPRLKGFEIHVNVPAMRDTSEWDKGRLQNYQSTHLVFDVLPTTRVKELKFLLASRIPIPASRHKLTAHVRKHLAEYGEFVELDEESKTLGDYGLDKYCVCIHFAKSEFDENGDYIFDDAYWDDSGYHQQPPGAWIPEDSISDRRRPDANPIDPNQPLSIVSDRRAAER
eukprot:TRINITY_DN39907_c0_g1_i1.p1 TRINITY_DN39907_c0_g1~~TRINITY_DN39907_c0_g1_i1.p1  ORF type:complete len:314 (+),score=85.79 TRINITY_DN39907_c0_g1_i1:110-1051(+)